MNHFEDAFGSPQPGSLEYRVATSETLFDLLAKRAAEPLIPGSARENPLRRLPMIPAEGFVPALFDAWARVGDVLTFYQERIANEGYVATATEAFSVQQLVRALGYEPRPPLSARTTFAFALSTAKGAVAEALIPAGTPIGAAPPPDGSPAPIFETGEDVQARGEWNAVPLEFPDPGTAAQGLFDAARLTGSDITVLQRGAPLVIRRTAKAVTSDVVTTIVDVQPDPVSKSAFVQWSPPVDVRDAVVQFVAFRASTGLFGAKASEWRDLSAAMKVRSGARRAGGTCVGSGAAFASLVAGAPQDEDVVALGFADGALHALTARRLMRWDGAGWRTLMQEPRGGMLSFAAAPGALYLGTSRGDVRVSRDGGISWSPVGSAASGAAALGVAVHALVVRPLSVPVVFAGTERGVAVARDDGSAWSFVNDKLGGAATSKDGRVPVAVVALALRDTTLLAATSAGVWTADAGAGLPASCSWVQRPVRAARPDTLFTSVAFAHDAFAAGDGGLFRCDASWAWQRVDDPAIAPAPRVVAADTSAVVTAAQNGIAISSDGGTTWSVKSTAPNAPACAVALDPGSALVAYAEPLGDFPPEWEGFALSGAGVDLDRLVPSLTEGAQVVLSDGAPAPPLAQAARVASANAARRKAFGQTALVTHVEFHTPLDVEPALFGRRTTRLYYDARVYGIAAAQGSVLPLAGDAPDGDTVYVDGALTPFPAGRPVAVRGRAARIRVTGLAGGVRQLAPNGVASASALAGLDCLRVVLDRGGTLYALTSQAAWRRPAGSTVFARWGVRLPATAAGHPALLAIAVSDAGAVVTTTTGVYRRGPDDADWQGPVEPAGLTAVIADAPAGAGFWAGGPDGMWHSDDRGATWQRVAEDGAPAGTDPESAVASLAWDGATLLAGTAAGVAVRDGGRWRISRNGLTNRDVIALAAGAGGWFAGTDGGGVYRSTDRGRSWSTVTLAIPSGPHSVRALAIADAGVYAAVRGYGVLVLGANDVRFHRIDRGIGNDVRGLAAGADGVWAAARSGTVLASPAFVPQEISLHDLGGVEYTPATGDALDRGTVPAALRVDLATQLKLPIPPKTALRTVEPKRRWLLSGDGIGDLLLRTQPDASGLVVSTIASFIAAAPPNRTNGTLTWRVVLDGDGLLGTFDAKSDEVEYAASHDDDPLIGEEAVVVGAKSEPERGITTLSFEQALRHVYDGRTAVLLGNCARGSHGMSSSTYEPIGSGDASRPNQSFALKRANLSMLARTRGAPEPQITVIVRPAVPRGAITSAGDLRVDQTEAAGVTWSPVEHLTAAGPRERVYTVREDEHGRSIVEFGDGEYGARLPAGIENVVAMYRTGNGPSGNIAAGSALQLRKRSSALASVTNPVPASGGAAGENPSSALATAQRGLCSLERIVAPADLEDFALARGGIAKAKLRVGPGRPTVAHLTLAGDAGEDAFTAGAAATELLAAIRASGAASLAVVLHGYRSRWVRVGATLSAGAAVPRDAVLAEAALRLRAELSFERRALGEGLPAARVIEILQRTSAVEAVTLTAFHDAAWSPVLAETIPGSDDRSLIDGELLIVLDPDPAQLRLSVVAS